MEHISLCLVQSSLLHTPVFGIMESQQVERWGIARRAHLQNCPYLHPLHPIPTAVALVYFFSFHLGYYRRLVTRLLSYWFIYIAAQILLIKIVHTYKFLTLALKPSEIQLQPPS